MTKRLPLAPCFLLAALLIAIGIGCTPERPPQDQPQESPRNQNEAQERATAVIPPTPTPEPVNTPQLIAPTPTPEPANTPQKTIPAHTPVPVNTPQQIPPTLPSTGSPAAPTPPVPPETSAPGIDTSDWETYRDQRLGFEFSYPPNFGTPGQGTGRDVPGTRDMGQAIRFSEFSSGIRDGMIYLEGEVVVTSGRPWVAAQALGGVHDSLTLGAFIEVLSEPLRAHLLEHASGINAANFCAELAKEQHLDPNHPALASLPPAQREAILELDKLRNQNPRVTRCQVSGDTVVFLKQATFRAGSVESRQNIYGAIRFLEQPYSSVQLVRVTVNQPADQLLGMMASVVDSFEALE